MTPASSSFATIESSSSDVFAFGANLAKILNPALTGIYLMLCRTKKDVMIMYDSARRAELRAIKKGSVGADKREVANIVERDDIRELGARERPSIRSLLFCDTVHP